MVQSLHDHAIVLSVHCWLSLVLSYIATPTGVIAGVIIGVFLAFVLIFVVAVIVAAVVLVHRRKTVPGMGLNMSMW